MPTELENALNGLIEVFHKYSQMKGNNHAVGMTEFRTLIDTECPQYTRIKDSNTWFRELDINSDGAVSFEEYLILLIKIGVIAHKQSHNE
ncbi:protein S100-A8 [Suncus etruscus]|uniref:protein S100-A8 n=1 Tax=Suncus etruscus TaxID=109475 RepID=UPI002110A239|nr:protein S100-A8 [Suncus etruscus]